MGCSQQRCSSSLVKQSPATNCPLFGHTPPFSICIFSYRSWANSGKQVTEALQVAPAILHKGSFLNLMLLPPHKLL
jgi:hypothetical protein